MGRLVRSSGGFTEGRDVCDLAVLGVGERWGGFWIGRGLGDGGEKKQLYFYPFAICIFLCILERYDKRRGSFIHEIKMEEKMHNNIHGLSSDINISYFHEMQEEKKTPKQKTKNQKTNPHPHTCLIQMSSLPPLPSPGKKTTHSLYIQTQAMERPAQPDETFGGGMSLYRLLIVTQRCDHPPTLLPLFRDEGKESGGCLPPPPPPPPPKVFFFCVDGENIGGVWGRRC